MINKNISPSKGFSLVEVLIVVFIITVLVAIPIPYYMQHTKRAKASEATATMAMLRQTMRDYFINNNTYFDVTSGNIDNALPLSVTGGVPNPGTAGLDVDVGVVQYFSNASYSVDVTNLTSARFTNPAPVDFIVRVNGNNSVECGNNDCAIHKDEVAQFRLEMDNSGRIFVSYDAGANWSSY